MKSLYVLRSSIGASLVALSVVACGGSSSNACAPFESCDAVVGLVLDNMSSSGTSMTQICDGWRNLSEQEKDAAAQSLSAESDQWATEPGAEMFTDPQAASAGVAAALLQRLNSQCT